MNMITIEKLYSTNAEFKKYVDRYCVKHQKQVKDAFKDALVIYASEQYAKKGECSNASAPRIVNTDQEYNFTDDKSC